MHRCIFIYVKFLYREHTYNYITCIIHTIPNTHTHPVVYVSRGTLTDCPHFKDEGMEAQGVSVTYRKVRW